MKTNLYFYSSCECWFHSHLMSIKYYEFGRDVEVRYRNHGWIQPQIQLLGYKGTMKSTLKSQVVPELP